MLRQIVYVMHLALFRPEIPPNTGNIARQCVLTGTALHIIGQPAFSLDAAAVRRAGLDYWSQLELHRHANWDDFRIYLRAEVPTHRIFLLSRFASHTYSSVKYQSDDVLVLGQESSGLPQDICNEIEREYPAHTLRIPVREGVRSLNLANAAAIVLFEALRQLDFPGLESEGPALPG